MRGGVPVAVALGVFMPLSGCLFFPDHGLEEIFGQERVSTIFGRSTLTDVLQVRVLGEDGPGPWDSSLTHITAQSLVVEKDHPGPQGGGGETHLLPDPEFPTIEVRFDEAERLANFTARWELTARHREVVTVKEHASRTLTFDPPYAAEYEIRGSLEKDGKTIAQTRTPLIVQITAIWTVDSSVFPLRIEDTPPPSNYDDMRDVFQIEVKGGTPPITLETEFRGEYNPAQHGTDVDLGLFDPDDEPMQCIGAGGGAGRLPDPAAAEETITHDMLFHPGTYSVHVGTLRSDCSNQTWYHNQGPVPYRLHVETG